MSPHELDAQELLPGLASLKARVRIVGPESEATLSALIERVRTAEADLEQERAVHAADHLIARGAQARADKAEAERKIDRDLHIESRRLLVDCKDRLQKLERAKEALMTEVGEVGLYLASSPHSEDHQVAVSLEAHVRAVLADLEEK